MKNWSRWYVAFTCAWICGVLFWQMNWSSNDAPAWVQAVGSVFAIVAAAGIALWQRHDEKRQRDSEAKEQSNKSVALASLVLARTQYAISDLAQFGIKYPMQLYRDGNLERLRELGRLLAELDLTQLSINQAEAIVSARDDCVAAMSLLISPAFEDDTQSRAHTSKCAENIVDNLKIYKSVFPQVVQTWTYAVAGDSSKHHPTAGVEKENA